MIPKTKKESLKAKERWAERRLQELGRETFTECEVCGAEYTCLHHFFPKSGSLRLRYDPDNLIPICHGCHFRHHNGDPRPHATVIKKRGWSWYRRLLDKKLETVKKNADFYDYAITELGEYYKRNGKKYQDY